MDALNTSDGGRPVVALADPIHGAAIEKLRQSFDVRSLFDCSGQEERDAIIAIAHALVVRVLKTDASLMDRAPHLKLIAKCGTGTDNIDIAAATERSIFVTNTPNSANATAVAEGAVGLMLAVLRRICEMDACVREDNYGLRWTADLRDLRGKTLGLVGFGEIARHLARTCRAGFDMTVLAFDPYISKESMAKLQVEKVETIDALMTKAEVVSIHVPLTKETHHLIGKDEMRRMRPSAILINTSRGPVVDEAALVAALKEKRLAGAGLDVFEKEPPAADNPLFEFKNVTLSPHLAGVTEDSVLKMSLAAAEAVQATLSGQRAATLLNAEVWERCRS